MIYSTDPNKDKSNDENTKNRIIIKKKNSQNKAAFIYKLATKGYENYKIRKIVKAEYNEDLSLEEIRLILNKYLNNKKKTKSQNRFTRIVYNNNGTIRQNSETYYEII